MGIKKLNKFLQEHCASAIEKKSLFQLKNKKIVVDASNMLYRLNIEGELIPMLYQTINTFKYYNIVPLFIFDGIPPEDKKDKLIERRRVRLEAQDKYDTLLSLIEAKGGVIDESLKCELNQLEKTKTRLSFTLLNEVKYLLKGCGIPYINAVNEADELCAYLVNKGHAWACMSEDMDLFVHGCVRVIRYFSLCQHNCVVYDLAKILAILNIKHEDFKAMCVFCGGDYNKTTMNVFDVWHEYGKSDKSIKSALISSNHMNDVELFNRVYDAFEVDGVGDKSGIDDEKFVIEFKDEMKEIKKYVLDKNGFY